MGTLGWFFKYEGPAQHMGGYEEAVPPAHAPCVQHAGTGCSRPPRTGEGDAVAVRLAVGVEPAEVEQPAVGVAQPSALALLSTVQARARLASRPSSCSSPPSSTNSSRACLYAGPPRSARSSSVSFSRGGNGGRKGTRSPAAQSRVEVKQSGSGHGVPLHELCDPGGSRQRLSCRVLIKKAREEGEKGFSQPRRADPRGPTCLHLVLGGA